MQLQDRLADALASFSLEPRSPDSADPDFDLAFCHGDIIFVVEVKTGVPPSPQQVRLGCGQVLEYAERLRAARGGRVQPGLLLEGVPPDPWPQLLQRLDIGLLRADDLDGAIHSLLSGA